MGGGREGAGGAPGEADLALAHGEGDGEEDEAGGLDAGDAREEAYAEMGGDEGGGGIDVVAFEDDGRADAGDGAELVGEDAQAVVGLEGDEGLAFEVLQVDALPAGEGMVLRHDGEEFFRVEVEPSELLHVHHDGAEADVGFAFEEAPGEDGGVVLVEIELDVRIELLEFAQELGQDVDAEGVHEGEADDAVVGIALAFDLLPAFFELAQGPFGVDEEALARGGEEDLPAAPFEERRAELLLELVDGAGEGGLGDGNFLRCAREVARIGKGAEVFQLVDFHRASFRPTGCLFLCARRMARPVF